MTLQVALVGSNGVLLASDTRQAETHSLEWSVQTMEDADKVVLNSHKTIAAACSGRAISEEFVLSIIDVVGSKWGMEDTAVNKPCSDLWKAEQNERPLGIYDSRFLIVHSEKRQIYSILFSKDKGPIVALARESRMRFGVHQGNDGNPAYFFVHRYFPEERVPVERLVRLAAHYIWMAHRLNPYGVGGLTIHLSKDGNPFEEVPEENILQLMRESNRLDLLISEFLLTPLSASDSANLEFLKLPKRG